MPESAPEFEDVNERAKEDWKRDTSPFDRVRSVMRTAYEPMSAATVAENALTSEQTARKHLRSLAEHGYVAETASPDSTNPVSAEQGLARPRTGSAYPRRDGHRDALNTRSGDARRTSRVRRPLRR